jgi:Holliday junction resolvase RusA-like endonuclease
MIEFTYYGEIRGKGRPRFRKIGNFVSTYTPTETRDYEMSIKESFLVECADSERFFNGEQLAMELQIYQAIPKSVSKKKAQEMLEDKVKPTKKPDIDNILKSVCDSLNKVAYTDDTQIVEMRIQKHYAENSYMVVKLWKI